MVMAVKLAHHRPSNYLILIAGYEGGFTAVHLLAPHSHNSLPGNRQAVPQLAQTIYISQPHAQPLLSLDASPDATIFFTSSADSVITAHRVPELPLNIDSGEKLSSRALIGTASTRLPNSEVPTRGLDTDDQ